MPTKSNDTPVEVALSEPVSEPVPTVTPPQYAVGAVKQDPISLAVAVRTDIVDPDGLHDWGVMTVDRGGHYADWDEVSGWTDKV